MSGRETIMPIDAAALLQEVTERVPCGPSHYDSEELHGDFIKVMALSVLTPEVTLGKETKPAVLPNWLKFIDQASAFFRRSKDLDMAVQLARALLVKEGLEGFLQGVSLIRALLQRYWEAVHPGLRDSDGDYDPDYRLNAINELASDMLLNELRVTSILKHPKFGVFSLRLVEGARGLVPVKDAPAPALVEAVFEEADQDTLQGLQQTVDALVGELAQINSLLDERLGGNTGTKLARLVTELDKIGKLVQSYIRQSGEDIPMQESPDDSAEAELPPVSGARGAVGSGVKNREDVKRQIELICAYYRKYEPSSPIPLLLERARQLVDMDFIELVKNLSPGGITELLKLVGPKTE